MTKKKRFTYDFAGFDELIAVRMKAEHITLIKKIMRASRSVDGDASYESISEFLRGSAVKRIREERKRLKI